MGFIEDFKKFAMRGNVIDLAVGVIIGAAFGKITGSLVNDILMPPLGMMLGKVNFNDLFIVLGSGDFKTLADAKAAGAPTINYGTFISTIIDFIFVAFAVFLLVKAATNLTKVIEPPTPAAPSAPTNKECPFCFTSISIKATKCPNCTSSLSAAMA